MDLSIAQMFGGFSEEFYSAYYELMPKQEGEADRIYIYQLYHYLNHLNIFGSAYYPNCLAIMKYLLGRI